MEFINMIIGILLWAVGAGLVIWIVGKMGLGLTVDGFVPAMIAAIAIAVVAGLITWGLGLFGITLGGTGIMGAIVSLVVAAVVLLLADKFVPGMQVKGFGGEIIAAIAIGVVNWLIVWVMSLFGFA